jgi:hypothetical protein
MKNILHRNKRSINIRGNAQNVLHSWSRGHLKRRKCKCNHVKHTYFIKLPSHCQMPMSCLNYQLCQFLPETN